jgi:hypothetical protein
MAGFTNKFKKLLLEAFCLNTSVPSSFKLALLTSAATLTADTNVWADVSANEIVAGNGYTTKGNTVARSSGGFDDLTEDDSADTGYIRLTDVTYTASGGPIPLSGDGARYAVLLDNNDNILAWWDFGTDRSVTDTQSILVQNAELRLEE